MTSSFLLVPALVMGLVSLLVCFLSSLKRSLFYHVFVLFAGSGSGSGFGFQTMNMELRMTFLETWILAVWGLCWRNYDVVFCGSGFSTLPWLDKGQRGSFKFSGFEVSANHYFLFSFLPSPTANRFTGSQLLHDSPAHAQYISVPTFICAPFCVYDLLGVSFNFVSFDFVACGRGCSGGCLAGWFPTNLPRIRNS